MMRLVQNNFNAGLLSPSVMGRTDLNKYPNGLEVCTNWVPQVQGGIKTRPGMKLIGAAPGSGAGGVLGRFIPFNFNSVQSYVLLFQDDTMYILKDGGFVVYPVGDPNAGEIVEIVSPFGAEAVDELRYTQIFDTMYLVHPDYPRYKLQRTDHHDWTFTAVTDSRPASPTFSSVVYSETPGASTTTVRYCVTSVDGETGAEGFGAFSSPVTVDRVWPAGATVAIDLYNTESISGFHRVYKSIANGAFGFIGEMANIPFGFSQFVDDNIAPGATAPPSAGVAFSATGDRPGAVGMFEQRMFYGGTDNQPQTVWGSETSRLDSFNTRQSGLLDTDSVEFTIFSELSERVLHFVSLEKMLVFTSESEKIMDAGANADGITPTSVRVRTRSRHGASSLRPLVVGNEVLFVQRERTRILNMFYSLEADGYDTDDLNMLNPELFSETNPIYKWCYDPNAKVIWVVTSEGQLMSLTYDRRQQVWAWAEHETNGRVYDVARIPESQGSGVYLLTTRQTAAQVIAGTSTTYVERMTYRSERLSFCMDSYLIYYGSATTTVSGLDHIAGREVSLIGKQSAFGDFDIFPNTTVSATGEVEFPVPVVYAAVGLPFTCTMRPVKPVLQGQGQTSVGAFKLVNKAHIEVIDTRGLKISVPNGDKKVPVEVKPRTTEAYGSPSELQTGRIDLTLFGSWSRDGQVEITQEYPLPAHITSLVSEVEFED